MLFFNFWMITFTIYHKNSFGTWQFGSFLWRQFFLREREKIFYTYSGPKCLNNSCSVLTFITKLLVLQINDKHFLDKLKIYWDRIIPSKNKALPNVCLFGWQCQWPRNIQSLLTVSPKKNTIWLFLAASWSLASSRSQFSVKLIHP